jgi:DNA-binding beta-propeller fold protein YncE
MPPVGYDTVTAAEVDRLRNWIDAGAPSDDGDIPFEQVTDKIFTTNQTNDLVSVVDAASLLVMRIFEVGDIPNYTESPHGVTMSKSGEYFFVSMLGGTGKVFKYDARTGQSVGAYNLNQSQALMALSKDGTKLYVATNFLINNTGESGSISVLRASDLSLIKSIAVGQSPHGITLSRDGRLLYTMSVYQDRFTLSIRMPIRYGAFLTLRMTSGLPPSMRPIILR